MVKTEFEMLATTFWEVMTKINLKSQEVVVKGGVSGGRQWHFDG